jgi:hypothetical protein
MRSDREHGARYCSKNLFCDRAHKHLPEAGATASADNHQIRIVFFDSCLQVIFDATFLDTNLRADPGKRVKNFLAVLVILGFRSFYIGRPRDWFGHGIHNHWADMQGYEVGVIVFGNLSNEGDGMSGGGGEIGGK